VTVPLILRDGAAYLNRFVGVVLGSKRVVGDSEWHGDKQTESASQNGNIPSQHPSS
jgi:hypothetical protein